MGSVSDFFTVPSANDLGRKYCLERKSFFHLYASKEAITSLCGEEPPEEIPSCTWDKYATTKSLLQVCPHCAKAAALLTSTVSVHKCSVCGTLDTARDTQMCRDDRTGREFRMCRMCREDYLSHGKQYDLV